MQIEASKEKSKELEVGLNSQPVFQNTDSSYILSSPIPPLLLPPSSSHENLFGTSPPVKVYTSLEQSACYGFHVSS